MEYDEGAGEYWGDGDVPREGSEGRLPEPSAEMEGVYDQLVAAGPAAETHVDDSEAVEDSEDAEPKKKKKRSKEEKAERKRRRKEKRERKRKEKERKAAKELQRKRRRRGGGEGVELGDDKEDEEAALPEEDGRPIKKKRKQEMTEAEAAESVRGMLDRMVGAADADDEALSCRQPALAKLSMLDEICVEVAKPKWVHWYIREGVCQVLGRWLAPLPDGGLPNITIRTKILKLIQKMPLYVENLQGTTLGIRLIAMWSSSEELDENRAAIRDTVQSLMRPLLGIRWSQRPNDEMMDEMSIPKAPVERLTGSVEPSRRARIPMSTGYSFKVQPKSQFKGTQNETTRDGESTMARLSRMMAYKKTFGNRTATRAQNVSVSKSVI